MQSHTQPQPQPVTGRESVTVTVTVTVTGCLILSLNRISGLSADSDLMSHS